MIRNYLLLAAAIVAAGCRKADTFDRRGDTSVTPPVSAPVHSARESTAVVAKTCGVEGKPVLADDGIGSLKVGKSVNDIKSECDVISDAKEPGSEGSMERVVAVRIDGDVVRSTITDDKIWRIDLRTPHIRTRDSLGVDVPLSKIAHMRGAKFFPGEDGVYGFVAAHCGLSFRFSIPLRPPKGRDWTAATIDSAYGDALIDRVLVTRCQR